MAVVAAIGGLLLAVAICVLVLEAATSTLLCSRMVMAVVRTVLSMVAAFYSSGSNDAAPIVAAVMMRHQ
uniref:Uncharacterized protein n=1 Tax=Tanacetum cinerariifolium TaxID=118510 RepID=A0A699QHJ3_TANCI|nr:hypothetical protein [Tanacetum cinerariifolium]